MNPNNLLAMAKQVIDIEAQACQALGARLDHHFITACELMLKCDGRVIVTGMGKSGHIGGKIAATLASTGTPAFFVHPGEASHGDLGMITRRDVVIALSNSGETAEMLAILPVIKRLSMTVKEHEVVSLIGPSGSGKSTLLRCITGLETIDDGEILVHGDRITGAGVDINALRRDIGIVFQGYNLFPHMTVLGNVTLAPVKVLKLSRAAAAVHCPHPKSDTSRVSENHAYFAAKYDTPITRLRPGNDIFLIEQMIRDQGLPSCPEYLSRTASRASS